MEGFDKSRNVTPDLKAMENCQRNPKMVVWCKITPSRAKFRVLQLMFNI